MKKILPEVKYIASIEDASILRKFFILFFVAAIIPLLVIANIVVMSGGEEQIVLSATDLGFTLLFATLGVLAAFIGMRATLKKIIMINVKERPKAKAERNEIEALSKAFDVIKK
jgi:hypothetical protein